MRTLNQMLSRKAPVARLAMPSTPRYFATFRTGARSPYQEANEEDDYRPTGEDFENPNKGYAGREDREPRRVQPFNPEAFRSFHSMSARDLSAHIAREAGDAGSAETWISAFGGCLRNAEAHQAWKELDEEGRRNFINNVFHLNNEAQIVKKRFNLFPILQFIFEKSFRLTDAKMVEHVLQAVKDTNVNRIVTRQVLNSFFMEGVKSMGSRNMFPFRKAMSLAESLLHEAIQGQKMEPNPITAKKNYAGLANYLALTAQGVQSLNRTITRDVLHAFVNADFKDTTSNHAVLGWAAAGVLANNGTTTTVEGSDLIANLNDYIRFLYEGLRQNEPTYDDPEGGSGEGKSGQDSAVIKEIVPGKLLSAAQINGVAQGLFLSEGDKLRPLRVILELLMAGMNNRTASMKFRKWLCAFVRTSNLETMSPNFLVTLGRLLSKFVGFRRFAHIYKKLFEELDKKADDIKNPRDWAQILLALRPVIVSINQPAPEEGSAFASVVPEEEKAMYQRLFDRSVEAVTSAETVFPMDLGGKIIYHLRVIHSKMTPEQLHESKMHTVYWEQFEKRLTLGKEANGVFTTLLAYDLLRDEHAQDRLLSAIEKAANKFEPSGEEGAREPYNRTFGVLNKIMQMFEDNTAGHSGKAKQIHEKLKSYKAKERQFEA